MSATDKRDKTPMLDGCEIERGLMHEYTHEKRLQ